MRKSLNCFNHRGNRVYKAKNKLSIFLYRATLVTVLLSLMSPVGLASLQMREVESVVSRKIFVQTQTQEERKNEAVRLTKLGLKQVNQYLFKESLKTFEQAWVIFREIGEREWEGAILVGIGTVYIKQGEYPKALEFYQQALAIHQQIGSKAMESTTLNNIGEAYRNLGKYLTALEYYQKALAIQQKISDRLGEGTTLNNIALVHTAQGEYSKALKYYQQALAISQQIGDKLGESGVLLNIGSLYQNQGQHLKVLEYYQKALAIFQQIGDKSGEATILNSIGLFYNDQGEYSKVLKYYQQALAISQQIGDKLGEGKTLNNIGAFHDSLGQSPEALENYQQALSIAKQIGDKLGEGRILNNIGLVYSNQEQYSKALDYYQQALTSAKQIGYKLGESTRLNNIGGVYQEQQQYSKALDYYQQALSIAKQIGYKGQEGKTLNNIGQVYDYQRQYPKALEYYQEALSIAKQVGDKATEGIILNNIGVVYNIQGKYFQAETNLQVALEVWESLRKQELKDEQKISIFELHATTYRSLQETFVAQNKIDKALEISERGRARALIDLLNSRTTIYIQDTNPTSSNSSIAQIKKIAQQQKATFVEYSVIGDSKLYIWVVKPTGEIVFEQVDLKSLKTPLKKLVETSRRSIGVTGAVQKQRGPQLENPPLPSPETQKRYLQQLHELLITPIAKHLPKNPDERVIFIPHESLFLVPFPALKDANNKYLIEKHTILTAPAIQVLDYTRKKAETLNIASLQPTDTLLVGNPFMPTTGIPPIQQRPLPGAEKEAKKIAPILNTQPLIGKQATKSAVLQKISTAKIIHLATHGLLYGFGERIPGAIALAPDTPGVNEGLLKTTEIINLNLKADLVVLSACDTGVGEITGDGVVGLSRSLLTAGAESVIVSLWAVDDGSTSDLMVEFYSQLQQNPDRAKALRQAMLTTMKKHSHPIHWAAFTLIGNAE